MARNGAGKSNFLDAIYHLSRGKSFRTIAEGNAINWDSSLPFARIESHISGSKKLALILSQLEGQNRKRFEVDGSPKKRLTFVSNIKTVLFAPQDLDIVSGSPDIRRAEIDDFLSQSSKVYEENLREYKQVIVRRNKLLQRIAERKANEKELKFWDEKLVESGTGLIKMRYDTLNRFAPSVIKYSNDLFAGEIGNLRVEYLSRFADSPEADKIADEFLSTIMKGRVKELAAGRTLYGPHRDDLNIVFDNRPIRIFGSRGQQRIAALIIKFAMLKYLSENNQQSPILLLDDIMSELDPKHRHNLEEFIQELGTQCFITGTDESQFSRNFMGKNNNLRLQ